MQGYIKLYRQMVNWEWYTDGNTMRVFLHLLLLANHADRRWQGQEIKSGQLVTSISSLSKALKLTVKQIRTAVKHLENTEEIAIKTTNKFTLVTIANWASYQGCDEERASKTANEGQTRGKQRATNKNDKNDKTNINAHFDEFWKAYPRKVDKQKAIKAFTKINPNEDLLSTMLKKLEAYKKTEQWQKTEFIPHPTTWLNGRRWEDEITGGAPIVKYKCAD